MTTHSRSWSAITVLAFAALALFVLISTHARAAGPWYVAPGGDDSYDCLSVETPCATIDGAIGKASSGDIINVAIGVYTGVNPIPGPPPNVFLDKSLTLLGGWDSTFSIQDGSSNLDGYYGVAINADVTALIERFTVHHITNYGTVTLNSSLVHGNIGSGGIYNAGNLVANNTVISGNTNYGSGGGISHLNENTTAILNNSAVISNTATSYGGGMYVQYGTVILNNTTVSGNTAYEGGGIKTAGGGIVILNNSTVSGNTASNNGGGVACGGGSSIITLRNSIVAGNSATWGGSDCAGPITSAGYNLIGITNDGFTCPTPGTGDLTNVDPKLGSLLNNGGSSPTHALLFGSPAIDAGNPAGCTDNLGNPLNTDQRGIARVGRCDIGSYEYDPLKYIFLPLISR